MLTLAARTTSLASPSRHVHLTLSASSDLAICSLQTGVAPAVGSIALNSLTDRIPSVEIYTRCVFLVNYLSTRADYPCTFTSTNLPLHLSATCTQGGMQSVRTLIFCTILFIVADQSGVLHSSLKKNLARFAERMTRMAFGYGYGTRRVSFRHVFNSAIRQSLSNSSSSSIKWTSTPNCMYDLLATLIPAQQRNAILFDTQQSSPYT